MWYKQFKFVQCLSLEWLEFIIKCFSMLKLFQISKIQIEWFWQPKYTAASWLGTLICWLHSIASFLFGLNNYWHPTHQWKGNFTDQIFLIGPLSALTRAYRTRALLLVFPANNGAGGTNWPLMKGENDGGGPVVFNRLCIAAEGIVNNSTTTKWWIR